ncbi:DoxX family protein [Kordiimonas aquimaris]|uniref:DoxX family protein n=1 Tax=Kordiimonas aquimaris TaxID=707591 RepID=UPI0021D2502E|nr:DoxX family protein [Kordiimonas aquimaris]
MDFLNIGIAQGKPSNSIIAFRCLLGAFLMAHGWARLLAGGVAPFGVFLDAQGFPFGQLIAWAITLFEIVGATVFLLGRFVPYLSGLFAVIYTMGIILVHAREGWFVVGLGRNGMEYSILLISSLVLVGLHHLPEQKFDAGKDTDN